MCTEKRNKIQREKIYYCKNADGHADQSRIKCLLKNTSTCAQTFPSFSLIFFISLRCTTHIHTQPLCQVLAVFPRIKACSRGKRGIIGIGAKLSHYVLHYDLIHLRKKLLADNRDPSALYPVSERDNAQKWSNREYNLHK